MAPKKKQTTAHDLDRIIVRLPDGMREKLTERAVENGRSMTAEVVAALAEHLRRKDRLSALEGQMEALQNNMNRMWHEVMRALNPKKRSPPA